MSWFRAALSVLSVAVILGTAASAQAGEIHPLLRDRLNDLRDDEFIGVLVFLEEQANIRSLQREHIRSNASRETRHREVIRLLQQTAKQSQSDLLEYLSDRELAGAVDGYVGYWITNMVAVRCTKEEVHNVAAQPDVAEVWENFPVELIEPVASSRPLGGSLDDDLITPGLVAIGADRVWHELGITGAGRIVGNIDTGVMYGHPALMARWRGNFAPGSHCWLDPFGTLPMPGDYDSTRVQSLGHGTHTMGTICGLGVETHDTIGVAWGAHWIAAAGVWGGIGPQMDHQITQSFQWMADPDGNPNTLDDVPDVSSNSWGVRSYFSGYLNCDTRWNAVIYNMEAAGVVAVFSAGNAGPGSSTIVSPAGIADDDYFCFAVGAVDATNASWPYPIGEFSSRGPSDCPSHATKPEIVAPGVDVLSSVARWDFYGPYAQLSGTSMACPHVAGTIALMRQADPDLSVGMIKEMLMGTTRDLGDPGEDNDYGFGMLDAYTVVNEVLRGWGTVAGVITDGDGFPLDAVVELGDGRQYRTNSNGEFFLYLSGDSSHTLHISSWGFFSIDTTLWLPSHATINPIFIPQPLPTGVLAGRVHDQVFLPISGAEVRVLNTPLPSQMTNLQGEFIFTLPHSAAYGSYSVWYALGDVSEILSGMDIFAGDTLWVELPLVPTANLPMEPDEYGYMAYDRGDSDDPAEYDWIEIEPDSGGSGTRLNFTLNDQTLVVNLPFAFSYYGQSYDRISVCCNGWIAMGQTTATDYRNWPIPHASGPPAMLAPFWEDFDPRLGGSISYAHVAERGCFVVEFNRLAQAYPPDTYETFQVVLFDPQVHPTRTDDGNILFQYKQISDLSGCTVGIESPDETIGLQFLFDDGYDERAVPIDNRTAIRFTTGYSPTTGSATGYVTLVPSPPVVDAVVTIGSRHIRTNGLGAFTLHGIPAGVHAAVATRAGYETGRIENVTIYSDSMITGLVYTLYRLDPPFALQGQLAEGGLVHLQWQSPFPLTAPNRSSMSTRKSPAMKFSSGEKRAGNAERSDSREGNFLDELTGFRIFRNGIPIREEWLDTLFVDTLLESGGYDYWVTAVYSGGESDSSNHSYIEYVSAVEPGRDEALPESFTLFQNHPNPFNSSTEIRFHLPHSVRVQLSVFNVLGQTQGIRLVDKILPAGAHRVLWNGADVSGRALASGVYICRLQAGNFSQSRKMILLR